MKYIFTSILAIMMSFGAIAQSDTAVSARAFLIGENEKHFESLVSEHGEQLLNVCKNNMNKAYKLWVSLLKDLERFANDKEFDLKGTKIWINLFWNADGSIRNIVYYPKPNSKNMDFALLSDFLSDFAFSYQLALTNETPFSHYGSASFPTFYIFPQDK